MSLRLSPQICALRPRSTAKGWLATVDPRSKLFCPTSHRVHVAALQSNGRSEPDGADKTDSCKVDWRQRPKKSRQQQAIRKTVPGTCLVKKNVPEPVAHIVDKHMHTMNKEDLGPEEYRVIWWKRYSRQDRSWTKRSLLMAGGLVDGMDAVDLWIDAGRSLFEFLAMHDPTILTAGPRNTCMLEALRLVSELVGHPDMVPVAAWDVFLHDDRTTGLQIKKVQSSIVIYRTIAQLTELGQNIPKKGLRMQGDWMVYTEATRICCNRPSPRAKKLSALQPIDRDSSYSVSISP